MRHRAFSPLAAAAAAGAQDYPNRPVKIIVPFPAGGTADAVPRLVAEWLSRKWGQPVVIENPTGAAGNIGSDMAYRAEPDGYTLLSAPPPPLVINQNLYPNLSFDAAKFEPIIVMAQVPNSIIVNPAQDQRDHSAGIHRVSESQSGQGDVSNAGQRHDLASDLGDAATEGQVQVQHVPYRGTAPALQDLLSGNVDFMCDNLGVSLPLVEAGKLRLLGVATAKRMASLPNVPTIAETLPGFESVAWYAVVAPPKTPRAITEKINADINEALRQPGIAGSSEEVVGRSGRRFGRRDREISARGSRSLECSDPGGQDQAAVVFLPLP